MATPSHTLVSRHPARMLNLFQIYEDYYRRLIYL